MKGKTKAAVLMAALCVLGCSKSSDSSKSDSDAVVSEVDVSGSVDASEDSSSTVDLSKDASPSQEN